MANKNCPSEATTNDWIIFDGEAFNKQKKQSTTNQQATKQI